MPIKTTCSGILEKCRKILGTCLAPVTAIRAFYSHPRFYFISRNILMLFFIPLIKKQVYPNTRPKFYFV
jgi:hypothetical protein